MKSNTIPNIIAIDGPAASGKSTLALRLAQSLGYLYFDTGIMYRAITWIAILRKLDVNDEAAMDRLAEHTHIDVRPPTVDDGRFSDVIVGDQDITWEIRSPEVDQNVSIVAAYFGVRRALTAQQRRIGLRGKVVMVGRDIGTVVLPEADLKVYLDASAEERAKRRYLEIIGRGGKARLQEILDSVRMRDEIDSNRAIAPLRPADDAVIINSDGFSADEVYASVEALCK